MTTGKTIAVTRWTLSAESCLCFLRAQLSFQGASALISRRSRRLQRRPSEPRSNACHCCPFPHLFAWSDGTGCHDLSFLLSFKWTFSLFSFAFIKRLFSSSLLSAIRVVSPAYLRLLIFLLAIVIPACASSSLAFCMMYSAYKLNKQGDNIQPFQICNQSVVPCLVLTVASWLACRFLSRQIKWSGIPITLRIFYSLLWSTQVKALA